MGPKAVKMSRDASAITIQARARGRSVRAAVVHDVRFEYERVFRDLENVADAVVWARASTLCRPRERPLQQERTTSAAGRGGLDAVVWTALGAAAPCACEGAEGRASTELSAAQAEDERLEVEQELALIRRAMNARLAYLTTQLAHGDELEEQPGEA
jgi:hypothetical protein